MCAQNIAAIETFLIKQTIWRNILPKLSFLRRIKSLNAFHLCNSNNIQNLIKQRYEESIQK